jgi:type IV pilus assembly protein PilM
MSSSRVLAVDSGAGHVACGVFNATKNGRLVLEQFALESFNSDVALESQWSELVGRSLAVAAKRAVVSGPAVLSVPGHLTLTKFVKTPAVDKTKRAQVIQFEAQQNIPYPLPEVVWDYQTVSDDGLDLEVMLAAVKLDVTEQLCASVRQIGITPVGIAPSTLALYQAFKYNYPESTGAALIVNIGARSTNLLFIQGSHFFVRTIPLAGNSVTQAIADEIKQDFAQAESLKLQVSGGHSDLPETSPARAAVKSAAESFAGRLHLEITRSTVNYRRQSGGEQPGVIYLTGGASLLPALASTLTEKLKLTVEAYDPLRNVEVSPAAASAARSAAAQLADLVGLAIARSASEKEFTLLPPELVAGLAFRKQQPFYMAAAVIVVAALVLPILHFNDRVNHSTAQALKLEAQLKPLREFKAEEQADIQRIESIRKQITAIQSLVESKSNWINFFSDLQQRLVKVEDVWLEKLQVLRPATDDVAVVAEPGTAAAPAVPVLRLQLSGRLLDKVNPLSRVSEDSFERVKLLLKSFGESQFISSVEKEKFNPTQPGILSFDFILVVNPKKPL